MHNKFESAMKSSMKTPRWKNLESPNPSKGKLHQTYSVKTEKVRKFGITLIPTNLNIDLCNHVIVISSSLTC